MQATTFADWYRATKPGLLESVLRAVNRSSVAEEALDEAFERAFSRWERVQSMRSPNGWVYRVAVTEAVVSRFAPRLAIVSQLLG